MIEVEAIWRDLVKDGGRGNMNRGIGREWEGGGEGLRRWRRCGGGARGDGIVIRGGGRDSCVDVIEV